jgi:hypothetical protein
VQVEELHKIVRLKQHVAELGVRDALLAIFQTPAHRFLRHHVVHGEVLADVAQPFQISDGLRPIRVVGHDGGVGSVKRDEPAELTAHAFHIGRQRFEREQLAFGRTSAGVAHHARGAAHQHDGPVPRALQPGEKQNGQQTAHVQAIGGGVEPDVDGRGRRGQNAFQRLFVADLFQQAAGAQFGKYGRSGSHDAVG